jgi:hypothetical protein
MKDPIKEDRYKCDACNYKTSRLFNYDKHILTDKHITKKKEYDEQNIKNKTIPIPIVVDVIKNETKPIVVDVIKNETKLKVDNIVKNEILDILANNHVIDNDLTFNRHIKKPPQIIGKKYHGTFHKNENVNVNLDEFDKTIVNEVMFKKNRRKPSIDIDAIYNDPEVLEKQIRCNVCDKIIHKSNASRHRGICKGVDSFAYKYNKEVDKNEKLKTENDKLNLILINMKIKLEVVNKQLEQEKIRNDAIDIGYMESLKYIKDYRESN